MVKHRKPPSQTWRTFLDENVQASTGEVGGANQAVVARADNDDVMHTAARNSKRGMVPRDRHYSATFML